LRLKVLGKEQETAGSEGRKGKKGCEERGLSGWKRWNRDTLAAALTLGAVGWQRG